MAKVQSANEQAWHDLVAHPQHQSGIKHIMAERDGGGHGDHITGEQAQLHAGCALRHAIAHGGHTTRHLGGRAQLAGFVLDQVRVVLQRCMRRQHVVVGIDDPDIGRSRCQHLDLVQSRGPVLVCCRHGGKGMGHIGAAQALGTRVPVGGRIDLLQISLAARAAALGDAGGDGDQSGVECHGATSGSTW